MALYDAASDPRLVQACLQNDADAWDTLVGRYASLVYSIARRYGLNDDDAAEVFQNTWSTLWEHLGELRDHSRLGPWLITIAGRLAYRQADVRQRQWQRELENADQLLVGLPDRRPEAQPEDLAVALDEAAVVQQVLERLPPRCRELLGYLFYDPEAPTYAEIARRLGVDPDSVGPLRRRCLLQLRELLQEAGIA